MKTSAAGRAAITQREGRILHAYHDSVGVLTIGVGHTGRMAPPAVTRGMTITEAQCDAFLAADLAPVERALGSALKVPVTQNQWDAMVSWLFNVGAGYAKPSTTIIRNLNAGNVKAAAAGFDLFHKPTAIIGRRNSEKAQFLRSDTPLEPEISMTSSAPMPPITIQEPKPWYLSKGVIGGLIAVATPIITVLTHGAIHPDPASTTELVMKAIEIAGPVIGGGLAVWGRATATQPIGSKPQPMPNVAVGVTPPVPSMMDLPVSAIIDELPHFLSMLQDIGRMLSGASGGSLPNILKDRSAPLGTLATALGGDGAAGSTEPQAPTAPDLRSLAADLKTRMDEIGQVLANLSPPTPAPHPK